MFKCANLLPDLAIERIFSAIDKPKFIREILDSSL